MNYGLFATVGTIVDGLRPGNPGVRASVNEAMKAFRDA